MGERGLLCWAALVCVLLAGCEESKPRLERIEIASAHRACEEGEACGVVETSCTSQGCRCGVAVNEKHLLDYQKQLAECRGQEDLATCDFTCETPFGKCFKGACVLTNEPPELFRGGRSVQVLCEGSRGTYLGCPQCAPNERCKSCMPCECPSTHRWTKKGCRAVIKTEARDILVETRPSVVNQSDAVKARVHNNSKRTIWLKTVCGTPFYRLRKKEDAWEKGYEPFHEVKCRLGSVEIAPGKNRPFVVDNLAKFREPSGESVTPGSLRFELTYTDGNESFRHSGTVYSAQFDLAEKLSRR
ncbi:MAG: hypothetical protein WBN10_08180 [Polyangiales bacterium]